MSISLSSDITNVVNRMNQQNASTAKADSLQSSLSSLSKGASDEELMNVCKSFESYLLEQVMKQVKESMIPEREDENEYLKMFGDNLYQEYAKTISDSGQIGLAQQLFEAMRRDYGGTSET